MVDEAQHEAGGTLTLLSEAAAQGSWERLAAMVPPPPGSERPWADPLDGVRRLLATRLAEEPADAADLASAVGWGLAEQGRWAEAHEFVLVAAQAFDGVRAEKGSPRSRAWFDTMATSTLVEWHTLGTTRAFDRLSRELAGPRAANRMTSVHARALVALGRVHLGRQESGSAVVSFSRALRLSFEGTLDRANVVAELALARFRHGDWRGARQDSSLAATQAGSTPYVAGASAGMAADAIWPALSGDVGTARDLVDRARRAVTERPSVAADIVILHARIALAMNAGDWKEMVRCLAEFDDSGYRRIYDQDEWFALKAIALRNAGSTDEHRELLLRWEGTSPGTNAAYYWAHQGLAAHDAGRGADALSAAARAGTLINDEQDALGRGWTRIVIGTLTSFHGDPTSGMDYYEAAREEFRGLGADGFVKRCNEILQATAEHLASQSTDPLAALTAKQREVARLVAEGYTSAEMATVLGLSKKTVDFHVANIVSRLRLSGRRDIRRLLA
ncbi:helix-turn-helix domain-containing protein [Nocardioides lijunqiniae]|uniref:helix-turn-helix domain-containing protein n=1 Tax=Nocardioides lijunqiniae TaxID=2760832 RepID=UPI0018784830|nr:helix-turn-helix transcriptional regulator [Nocardioides lijunqiniae]